MPKFPDDFLPHSPDKGPPVPRFLPGWPATREEVERATEHYRVSIHRAAEHYRIAMMSNVEKYKIALMRRLPPGA